MCYAAGMQEPPQHGVRNVLVALTEPRNCRLTSCIGGNKMPKYRGDSLASCKHHRAVKVMPSTERLLLVLGMPQARKPEGADAWGGCVRLRTRVKPNSHHDANCLD